MVGLIDTLLRQNQTSPDFSETGRRLGNMWNYLINQSDVSKGIQGTGQAIKGLMDSPTIASNPTQQDVENSFNAAFGTLMGSSVASLGKRPNPSQLNSLLVPAQREIPQGNYLRSLKEEDGVHTLHREMSPSSFIDMNSGGYSPYGAPRLNFSETPEMALGQGTNKGLKIQIDTGDLQGKANLSKPALALSYANRDGEFLVDAQNHEILSNLKHIQLDKSAYDTLSNIQKRRLDGILSRHEANGVKITR